MSIKYFPAVLAKMVYVGKLEQSDIFEYITFAYQNFDDISQAKKIY